MNECKMMEDLYPLYEEGLLNEETSAFVKQHLKNCSACSEKFLQPQKPSEEPPQESDRDAETLRRIRKKKRRRTALISLCSILLAAVLLTCAQLAYVSIGKYRVLQSFKESVLSGLGFDEELWGDDMYIKHPGVRISWSNPEALYEYTPDRDNPTLKRTVAFPQYGYQSSPGDKGDVWRLEGTKISFDIFEDGIYQGILDSKSWAPNSERYDSFLKYCEENSLYGYVDLARFFIEYPLNGLNKKTELSELEIAKVVQNYRADVSFLGSRTIEVSEGKSIHLKRHYYPFIYGRVKGYALFSTWLSDAENRYELPDTDDESVPDGMTRHGFWYIALQMGGYVCGVRVYSNDIENSGYFANFDTLKPFIGGFQWSVTVTEGNYL